MKKYTLVALSFVIIFAVVIVVSCVSYNIGIGPVSKNTETKIFEVTAGSTYSSIAGNLKKQNLIKSETFYKIYLKIFKPQNLQAGTFSLNESMGVKGIIEVLKKGTTSNPNAVKITIPEGKHIEDVAIEAAKLTNNTKEELLKAWNSQEFLDKVINKYWFIDKTVKNSKLRYGLEGYFFASTYELNNKDVDAEYIAYKFLDGMDQVLTKYKKQIEESKFTVHEILTFATIIEHEAKLDIDRPKIAGVFMNRLEQDMLLQSCATIGYAINEWKLIYNNKDLGTDSPYNTYLHKGLPVGPGGLPSEKSIVAVLNPEKSDYLYFLANVYDAKDPKTYYSKTYSEHQSKCLQYLNKSC